MFLRILLTVFVSLSITVVLRAEDAKPIHILKTTGSVKWLAYTLDGRTLLTASEVTARGGADGHELRLWDVATGKLRAGPVKSDHVSASGSISPDGKTAATGSHDGSWQLWHLPDLTPGPKAQLPNGRIHRIAFSPDGKTFSVLRANYRKKLLDPIKANRVTYSAHTFDVKTGEPIGEAQDWPRELHKNESATVARISEPAGWTLGMSPAFGPNGRPVLPTAAETLALEVPNDHENCGGPLACAISPDRKRAISSGCNGQVVVWDYRTGKPIGEPLAKAENLQIRGNALLFSPKSDRVAVVRIVEHSNPFLSQPEITVYDVESRQVVGQPAKPGRTQLLDAMAFAPDGEALAVALRRSGPDDQPGGNVIQLWKFSSK